MKFYCLFDLIDYYRLEQKQSEKEMYSFFLKRGFKKQTLLFLKNNCATESFSGIMPAVAEYTGLTELEVYLSIGIVPEAYKLSFFNQVKSIAQLLQEKPADLFQDTLQPYFNTNRGSLYNTDCIEVLRRQPKESVDLVFADPPFNLSKDYGSEISDNLSMSAYISWSYQWIDECVRILKPGGSFFIYNIPKWSIYFADFLNKRLTMRSWIGVNMKYNLPLARRLYPAHYSLLYYTKGEKPVTFNHQRIPMETCRHCGGELHDYGGYKNKMNPNGINLSDIWSDIYPVRHKKTKNRMYNELPIKMLDRIISMSTNPGDVVFDPFGGSGTTYIVAELLERRWIGSELGDCNVITERFANIGKDRQLLEQVNKEKNTIFSDKTIALRRKNGFWLSEDFRNL